MAITILKMVLQYDEKDYPARKEIVECYKKKYEGHSQLEDYIRVSNLSQSYRNVHEAITDFEKHIAFDKGNYVFHRTWGVGRIVSIEGDEITIDFAKKRGHSMSLKMAVGALQTLAKDHIWVLKATWKKEKLLEKVKGDIPWTLKTVIKSFGNSCDSKRIKAELSPGVLSEKEWPSWNTKARDILKSDPSFGTSPDNIDIFTVRERPISVSEKLYNEFKAERNFFGRAAAIRSFVSRKDPELDSEYFAEMFSYLTSFLKPNLTSEQTMAAYFLIKELADKYPHLGANLPVSFTDIIKGVSDIPGLFCNLKDNKFKEEFLRHLQTYVPGWADIFVELFPRTMLASIISQLEKEGYAEKLTGMAAGCFERFRDRREAAVWLFKNAANTEWFKAANISFERQLIVLIHILDLTYRDIENQRETTEARKINKQVYNILFKEGVLVSFINNADTDTITRIYTFINDVKNLDPQDKINLRSKIQDLHPDFVFLDITEKRTSQGLIVTKIKYEEKQRQLAHIMDVEIPANSREIEDARIHGDLKENAEYHAAKEKQVLLNTTVERLKEDIDRAQIFDPATIDTSRVSFGTVAVLQNQSENQKEEYTILGPWESAPENNIISYQTPFGKAMLSKTQGEYFNFLSDGEKKSYMVEEIKAAAI
jgi:transcription elongation factor GreA